MVSLIHVQQVCCEGHKVVSDKRVALINLLCFAVYSRRTLQRRRSLKAAPWAGRLRKGEGFAWYSRMAGVPPSLRREDEDGEKSDYLLLPLQSLVGQVVSK